MKSAAYQQLLDIAAQEYAAYGHCFSGSVSKQPSVPEGGLRVCGHTLSQPVAEAFRDLAKRNPARKVHIVGRLEGLWNLDFCRLVKKNFADRLGLASLRGKDWLLQLPEDLTLKHVQASFVSNSDYRVGLRGQLACKATRTICRGSIIGPYRSLILWWEDFRRLGNSPPVGWLERHQSRIKFRHKLDEYAADSCFEATGLDKEIAEGILQNRTIVSSAWMHGNLLALVNDAREDPLNKPESVAAPEAYNCALKLLAVGGWPFFFLVAIRDIQPDEELLYDYEEGYWHKFRENADSMKDHEADMASLRAAMQAEGASLRVSACSGEDRVSGIATHRDVVTVKLDSDGGRELVCEHPVPPLSPFQALQARPASSLPLSSSGQRRLPPNWKSLDEHAQESIARKRPKSAPASHAAAPQMPQEGFDGKSPRVQGGAEPGSAAGTSRTASGGLKRLVKAADLTQAQILQRQSRSLDGATRQPAPAHTSPSAAISHAPDRSISLPRGSIATADCDPLKPGGSRALSKASGSLGMEGRQSLVQSPPAKKLPFLRPAERPKPSHKGLQSPRGSMKAAPLRPNSAGRAGLGPMRSISSLQGPVPAREQQQQPDRPLSASPPPVQPGARGARGRIAARVAEASAVPVGKHWEGADARVNRYLHCATPEERRQMRQFRDSSLS
ncbi:hypothetical protein WJX73_000996 [Symbiochloris irregularis]|uniref:SET domain-containing protein n=1 Tax=Symbiochloris irregularis TaxID=706552 RepID=A0AAW1NZF8_9CHLO